MAQEGQASLARVEAAQESQDEEMTEARVTNNADNVELRIDELREDSTEVTDRMEDGNTPVGGPLVRVFHRRETEDQRKQDFLRTRCWSMQTCRKCASTR